MVSKLLPELTTHLYKYMTKKTPNSYILYLDANNLYGWATNQPLQLVVSCGKNTATNCPEGYIIKK